MRDPVETESVRAHPLPHGRGGRMCDEDRGEQDGRGRFFWHIASRRTRLRQFSRHHLVECRSSTLSGTPYFPSLANHVRVAARSSQHLFSREGCVEKSHSLSLSLGGQ